MKRRKFTSKFNTQVVLEALKEHQTAKEIAMKFQIAPSQVSKWKEEFLSKMEGVFDKPGNPANSEADLERDCLLQKISMLKVEVDFLKNLDEKFSSTPPKDR